MMRTKAYKWMDISSLFLSGLTAIGFLTALYYRENPFLNYREMHIGEFLIGSASTALALLLLIIQAFGIVHRLTYERLCPAPASLIARFVIAIAILLIFLFNYDGFPGVMASTAVRQEWAMKEFQDYQSVVKSIKTCPAIVDRVGQVNFVAPTRGTNYIVYEPGSSGHSGELTLEVVGDKATGVANCQFHIFTGVGWVQWTHHNKTETLKCF